MANAVIGDIPNTLGEDVVIGGKDFIVTSRLQTEHRDGEWIVLTPIPEGMAPEDLGHKFFAPECVYVRR